MAAPGPLLRYLRDCYRADAGGAAVLDLFERKVEHLRFFDREVLLTGELERRPVHASDGAAAADAAPPVPALPPAGPLAALAAALRAAGGAVWPTFEVAGTSVDLLVEDGEEGRLALDLVGGAAASGRPLALERCRMLGRAGLPVFPLPARLWARDPTACLAALLERLRRPQAPPAQ